MSSTAATRRSTRTRGGNGAPVAAAATAAAEDSPLQPVATNSTPSKQPNSKPKSPAQTKSKSKSSTTTNTSTSYSLRKRSSANDSGTNENETNLAAMSDRAFEALLRHHEELGLASKKRRLQYQYVPNEDGTIGNGQIAAALDQLPSPCITLVFEMLPRCRDVFNLAFLSKHLLSHIEPRTDIIIRTAVFENRDTSRSSSQAAESSGVVGRRWGGVSKKRDLSNLIVTQIADDVRNRAVHVPSALRLLRLLCATRCEKMEQCWGYRLDHDQASNCLGTGQKEPRPFSFAVCSKCAEHCGRKIPNFWQNPWVRDEPKVMMLGNKFLYHPTANANLGEKIGPILSARNIMQICSSYKSDGVEAQKEAFDKMVEEIYGKEGDDKYEGYEKAAAAFVQQYDEADEALDAFLQAKEDATAVNRQALYARKKATISQIMEILAEAVEGLPDTLRDLALDHAWREDDTTLRFGTPFVSNVLQRFVSAPSYATQKAVDEAVAGIRAKLDVLNANPDFLSLAFLEPPENAEEAQLRTLRERLKQKIRNYLLQNLPDDQTTLQWLAGRSLDHHRWMRPTNHFDDAFFRKIERNQNGSALLYILERKCAPLTDIVKATLVEDGEANLSNLRLLAGRVWKKLEADRKSRQGWGSMFSSYSAFQDQVRMCRTQFRKMKRHAQEYVADPAVVQWIAAQPQGGFAGLTRAAAVDSIWDVETRVLRGRHYHSTVPENVRGVKPYELLLDRNFAKLLDVHKYYVQQRTTNVH